jgi:phosphoglycerol transferase MdoB-like AlkP superfamily enzyme
MATLTIIVHFFLLLLFYFIGFEIHQRNPFMNSLAYHLFFVFLEYIILTTTKVIVSRKPLGSGVYFAAGQINSIIACGSFFFYASHEIFEMKIKFFIGISN